MLKSRSVFSMVCSCSVVGKVEGVELTGAVLVGLSVSRFTSWPSLMRIHPSFGLPFILKGCLRIFAASYWNLLGYSETELEGGTYIIIEAGFEFGVSHTQAFQIHVQLYQE